MQEVITYVQKAYGMWDGRWGCTPGNSNEYTWFDSDKHCHFQPCQFLKARKKNFWENRTWDLGFVLTNETEARDMLARKAVWLKDKGWQGHRIGSVPGIHNYKGFVRDKRSNGLKAEFKHNELCETFYKNFKGLVRLKRKRIPTEAMDWDFYDLHGARERGWKRTKKRKQWMK